MPHRALAARQGEDGAENGADARCPSNGEGQAHREGSNEAGGLVPDLELPGPTQRAPLEDAGDVEAEQDDEDAAADPDPLAIFLEEVARRAERRAEAHEDGGEARDEGERVQEDARALENRDLRGEPVDRHPRRRRGTRGREGGRTEKGMRTDRRRTRRPLRAIQPRGGPSFNSASM